jgi:hypothetical protein
LLSEAACVAGFGLCFNFKYAINNKNNILAKKVFGQFSGVAAAQI